MRTIKSRLIISRRNPQSRIVLVMGNGNDINGKILVPYRDEVILAFDLLCAYFM
jgi:hypothetical protein